MNGSDVKKPASPEFLNQPLIPLDAFCEKMRAVAAVPKSELDERLASEEAEKADKPKRGRREEKAKERDRE